MSSESFLQSKRPQSSPSDKKPKDKLLCMAIAVLALVILYTVWCWIAKIVWDADPPEGVSLGVFGGAASQLLGGSGIQIGKYLRQVAAQTAKGNKSSTAKE